MFFDIGLPSGFEHLHQSPLFLLLTLFAPGCVESVPILSIFVPTGPFVIAIGVLHGANSGVLWPL